MSYSAVKYDSKSFFLLIFSHFFMARKHSVNAPIQFFAYFYLRLMHTFQMSRPRWLIWSRPNKFWSVFLCNYMMGEVQQLSVDAFILFFAYIYLHTFNIHRPQRLNWSISYNIFDLFSSDIFLFLFVPSNWNMKRINIFLRRSARKQERKKKVPLERKFGIWLYFINSMRARMLRHKTENETTVPQTTCLETVRSSISSPTTVNESMNKIIGPQRIKKYQKNNEEKYLIVRGGSSSHVFISLCRTHYAISWVSVTELTYNPGINGSRVPDCPLFFIFSSKQSGSHRFRTFYVSCRLPMLSQLSQIPSDCHSKRVTSQREIFSSRPRTNLVHQGLLFTESCGESTWRSIRPSYYCWRLVMRSSDQSSLADLFPGMLSHAAVRL